MFSLFLLRVQFLDFFFIFCYVVAAHNKNSKILYASEMCRIRSTGVDSGRSSTFPAGAGAGPGVDIFE